jgi:parallel beta-helix repeat protein
MRSKIGSPWGYKIRSPYDVLISRDGDFIVAEDQYGAPILENVNAVTVINAALEAGYAILLTEGSYEVDASIAFAASNQKLFGTGPKSQITLADNSDTHVITIENKDSCQISDLYIDANKANQASGYGLRVSTCTRCIIDNIWLKDTKQHGIAIDNGGSHNIVSNCHMNGITLDAVVLCEQSHSLVDGCVLEDPGENGVNLYLTTDSTVSGCVAEGMTGNGGGIAIEGLEATHSDRNTISGCTIRNSVQQGIHTNAYSNFNVIVGNTIVDCGEEGIYSSGGTYKIIANNIISEAKIGIRSHSTYTIIDSNIAHKNDQYGMIIANGYSLIRGNIVTDNSQSAANTYDGIQLQEDADYCYLIGNLILDDQGSPTQKYGIMFNGADNCLAALNHFSGNVSAAISDTGTGNIKKENVGYVTSNRGSSVGTGAQQTIAHGLVITPAFVMLGNIDDGANPYQSAAADATNIYITAVNEKDYWWKAEI